MKEPFDNYLEKYKYKYDFSSIKAFMDLERNINKQYTQASFEREDWAALTKSVSQTGQTMAIEMINDKARLDWIKNTIGDSKTDRISKLTEPGSRKSFSSDEEYSKAVKDYNGKISVIRAQCNAQILAQIELLNSKPSQILKLPSVQDFQKIANPKITDARTVAKRELLNSEELSKDILGKTTSTYGNFAMQFVEMNRLTLDLKREAIDGFICDLLKDKNNPESELNKAEASGKSIFTDANLFLEYVERTHPEAVEFFKETEQRRRYAEKVEREARAEFEQEKDDDGNYKPLKNDKGNLYTFKMEKGYLQKVTTIVDSSGKKSIITEDAFTEEEKAEIRGYGEEHQRSILIERKIQEKMQDGMFLSRDSNGWLLDAMGNRVVPAEEMAEFNNAIATDLKDSCEKIVSSCEEKKEDSPQINLAKFGAGGRDVDNNSLISYFQAKIGMSHDQITKSASDLVKGFKDLSTKLAPVNRTLTDGGAFKCLTPLEAMGKGMGGGIYNTGIININSGSGTMNVQKQNNGNGPTNFGDGPTNFGNGSQNIASGEKSKIEIVGGDKFGLACNQGGRWK